MKTGNGQLKYCLNSSNFTHVVRSIIASLFDNNILLEPDNYPVVFLISLQVQRQLFCDFYFISFELDREQCGTEPF